MTSPVESPLQPDDTGRRKLVPCEFYLDPEEHEYISFDGDYERLLEPFPERVGDDRKVWRCRRLTTPSDDGPALCPFHQDPEERDCDDEMLSQLFLVLVRDERSESELVTEYVDTYVDGSLFENAEDFLQIEPRRDEASVEARHGDAVARRRKMFCGAQFGRFNLTYEVFDAPDRYPIDLQGGSAIEIDWSNAVVGSKIRANEICVTSHCKDTSKLDLSGVSIGGAILLDGADVDGRVAIKEADVNGRVALREADVSGWVVLDSADIDGPVSLENVDVKEYIWLNFADIAGSVSLSNSNVYEDVRFETTYVGGPIKFNNAEVYGDIRLDSADVNGGISFWNTDVYGNLRLDSANVVMSIMLDNADVYGTIRLNGADVGGSISLCSVDVNGDLLLKSVDVTGKISFHKTVVTGLVSLANADIDKDLSIGSTSRFYRGFCLQETEVGDTVQFSPDLVRNSIDCTELTAVTVNFAPNRLLGAIEFSGVQADTFDFNPPEAPHPVIRAVNFRACEINEFYLPENEQSFVYDFNDGSIVRLDTADKLPPERQSMYDLFRFVETDFTDLDFSRHRDDLFRNDWNLHGVGENREVDIHISHHFDDITDYVRNIVFEWMKSGELAHVKRVEYSTVTAEPTQRHDGASAERGATSEICGCTTDTRVSVGVGPKIGPRARDGQVDSRYDTNPVNSSSPDPCILPQSPKRDIYLSALSMAVDASGSVQARIKSRVDALDSRMLAALNKTDGEVGNRRLSISDEQAALRNELIDVLLRWSPSRHPQSGTGQVPQSVADEFKTEFGTPSVELANALIDELEQRGPDFATLVREVRIPLKELWTLIREPSGEKQDTGTSPVPGPDGIETALTADALHYYCHYRNANDGKEWYPPEQWARATLREIETEAAHRWVEQWMNPDWDVDDHEEHPAAELIREWEKDIDTSPTRDRDTEADRIIRESKTLSALKRVFGVRSPIVSQPYEDRPRTISLSQLESTYVKAKTAAAEMGENEAASAFFRREQRYIQQQNRRHFRTEVAITWGWYITEIYEHIEETRHDLQTHLSTVSERSMTTWEAVRARGHRVSSELYEWVPFVVSRDADSDSTGDADEPENDAILVEADPESNVDETAEDSEEGNPDQSTDGSDKETSATKPESANGTTPKPEPSSSDDDREKPNLGQLGRYGFECVENATLRILTGYGESPARVLGWWVGIIFLWTVFYYAVSLVKMGPDDPGDMWNLLVDQGLGFVLLSIGSFTTVIPPNPLLPVETTTPQQYAFLLNDPALTLLSEVEGLFGVLFISLFVLTLTRSIQR
ncbi:hypothetical protein [Salinigranum salinum]|uniref:hypothetical protein n=1 Tax=Salinigranum salinum TaxID=1364937 RepID=UPI0012609559|nr:hypothetical protein [Salinigranum salinum]